MKRVFIVTCLLYLIIVMPLYSWAAQPNDNEPLLEIIVPSNVNPLRIMGSDNTLEPLSQVIAFRVTYPDNQTAELTQATLEIYRQGTGVLLQPIEVIHTPRLNEYGYYEIIWNLSVYEQPGVTIPIMLSLTITNTDGTTVTVNQPGSVRVINASSEAVPPPKTETDRAFNPIFGVFLVVLIFLGILLYIGTRREGVVLRQQVATAVKSITQVYTRATEIFGSEPESGSSAVDTSANNRSATEVLSAEPMAALAEIHILQSDLAMPIPPIEINRHYFTIGREYGAGSHATLNLPFVSARHLSISYENYQFKIKDLNSANGTDVDGIRLTPERDYLLRSGSTIQISNKLKMEFRVMQVGEATTYQRKFDQTDVEAIHLPSPNVPKDDEMPPRRQRKSQKLRAGFSGRDQQSEQPHGNTLYDSYWQTIEID